MSAPACGARKADGSRCRQPAGFGTDHKGIGNCKFHGGASPGGRKHAARQRARRELLRLGVEPIPAVDPVELVLALSAEAAGNVEALRHRVAAGVDVATPDGQALVELYGAERDRAARLARVSVTVGAELIARRVYSETAAKVATAVRRIITDPAAGLTLAQQDALRQAVARDLRGDTQPAAPAALTERNAA